MLSLELFYKRHLAMMLENASKSENDWPAAVSTTCPQLDKGKFASLFVVHWVDIKANLLLFVVHGANIKGATYLCLDCTKNIPCCGKLLRRLAFRGQNFTNRKIHESFFPQVSHYTVRKSWNINDLFLTTRGRNSIK